MSGLDCGLDLGMARYVYPGIHGGLLLQVLGAVCDPFLELVARSCLYILVHVDRICHQRGPSWNDGCDGLSVVLSPKRGTSYTITGDRLGCSQPRAYYYLRQHLRVDAVVSAHPGTIDIPTPEDGIRHL